MEVTTIGIDLAKYVFQVHAVDAAGTRQPSGIPDWCALRAFVRQPGRIGDQRRRR